MQDRYLFRAKRLDNGQWVQGFICKKKYKSNKFYISCFHDKDDNEQFFAIDPYTICQSTGLKDKNGRVIWENDIVKHDFGEYQIGVQLAIVKYDSKYACYQIKPIFDWMYCDKSDCEVIGNIFDNPELLEV